MTPAINDAKRRAQEVIDANFVSEPPVRITDIAQNYGLQIRIVDLSTHPGVAGFIDPKSRTIFVSRDDAPTRQAFTVAHELGHWLMHGKELEAEPEKYAILYRKPLGEPNDDIVEKQANVFAASLLVPKGLLDRYKDVKDHKVIADIFGVSSEVIGYRLNHEYNKQAQARKR